MGDHRGCFHCHREDSKESNRKGKERNDGFSCELAFADGLCKLFIQGDEINRLALFPKE